MASTTIDMGRILKEKCVITIRIGMPRFWKRRWRLGILFIRLGAWIMGIGYGGLRA